MPTLNFKTKAIKTTKVYKQAVNGEINKAAATNQNKVR